jgi:hypothetical protein
MHAIHSENPPPTKSDDPIDITPSLDYIKELGDNDDMSIHDLSMKTVFLLALVTASRPSDLRRIDLFTLKVTCSLLMVECIKPKEYNIAKAHSLTTNKSASKRIYIGLYESSEYLCPYSALTTLIKRTQTWRDTTEKKKSLFLITREPYAPAASDTIANWIKSIIQKSSPTSSAKDMRTLSAFFLQNAGADLASILALGNWSGNSVYQRFYQRGIKLMLERNHSTSLILNEANSVY